MDLPELMMCDGEVLCPHWARAGADDITGPLSDDDLTFLDGPMPELLASSAFEEAGLSTELYNKLSWIITEMSLHALALRRGLTLNLVWTAYMHVCNAKGIKPGIATVEETFGKEVRVGLQPTTSGEAASNWPSALGQIEQHIAQLSSSDLESSVFQGLFIPSTKSWQDLASSCPDHLFPNPLYGVLSIESASSATSDHAEFLNHKRFPVMELRTTGGPPRSLTPWDSEEVDVSSTSACATPPQQLREAPDAAAETVTAMPRASSAAVLMADQGYEEGEEEGEALEAGCGDDHLQHGYHDDCDGCADGDEADSGDLEDVLLLAPLELDSLSDEYEVLMEADMEDLEAFGLTDWSAEDLASVTLARQASRACLALSSQPSLVSVTSGASVASEATWCQDGFRSHSQTSGCQTPMAPSPFPAAKGASLFRQALMRLQTHDGSYRPDTQTSPSGSTVSCGSAWGSDDGDACSVPVSRANSAALSSPCRPRVNGFASPGSLPAMRQSLVRRISPLSHCSSPTDGEAGGDGDADAASCARTTEDGGCMPYSGDAAAETRAPSAALLTAAQEQEEGREACGAEDLPQQDCQISYSAIGVDNDSEEGLEDALLLAPLELDSLSNEYEVLMEADMEDLEAFGLTDWSAEDLASVTLARQASRACLALSFQPSLVSVTSGASIASEATWCHDGSSESPSHMTGYQTPTASPSAAAKGASLFRQALMRLQTHDVPYSPDTQTSPCGSASSCGSAWGSADGGACSVVSRTNSAVLLSPCRSRVNSFASRGSPAAMRQPTVQRISPLSHCSSPTDGEVSGERRADAAACARTTAGDGCVPYTYDTASALPPLPPPYGGAVAADEGNVTRRVKAGLHAVFDAAAPMPETTSATALGPDPDDAFLLAPMQQSCLSYEDEALMTADIRDLEAFGFIGWSAEELVNAALDRTLPRELQS